MFHHSLPFPFRYENLFLYFQKKFPFRDRGPGLDNLITG
jgi:hypothetical protein